MDRWFVVSKLRMLSISSPKNSILKGKSLEKEKISIIPPRKANWPGSITKSTCSNPYSCNNSIIKSKLSSSPTLIFIVFLLTYAFEIIFSLIASGKLTIKRFFVPPPIRFITSVRKRRLLLSVCSRS